MLGSIPWRQSILSKNLRPEGLCSQLPFCVYFMDKDRKTPRGVWWAKRKANLVLLTATRKEKAAQFGALHIHKGIFNILSCYSSSLKVLFFFFFFFTIVEVLKYVYFVSMLTTKERNKSDEKFLRFKTFSVLWPIMFPYQDRLVSAFSASLVHKLNPTAFPTILVFCSVLSLFP